MAFSGVMAELVVAGGGAFGACANTGVAKDSKTENSKAMAKKFVFLDIGV